MMLGGLGLKIRKVPVMEATERILASVSSLGSRRAEKVLGILTLRGVQHIGEAKPNPRGAMKEICSVPRKTVLCVAELIVETVERALMPATVVVRVDTLSETVHRQRSGWM